MFGENRCYTGGLVTFKQKKLPKRNAAQLFLQKVKKKAQMQKKLGQQKCLLTYLY